MKAEEQLTVSERINEAVQKNRKPIALALGGLALLLIGVVAALSLADLFRKKAVSRADDFNRRYEELRSGISEESSADKVQALLDEAGAFAAKHSGYAGGRAWAVIAGIRAEQKKWPESETAWLNAAKAGAKTYLAPLAYFNAAVAAEEQGKYAEAIDAYTRSLSLPADFPAAPRAQFSVGRLREALDDRAAALEAYRAVVSGWPSDTVWTNLAHSRIIALEAAEPPAAP
jgi:tetratricopeptide (TPR) repeat protein